MRNKARETVLRQGCGTKMEGIGYLKIAAKDGAMEAGVMMWNNDDFNATQLYQLDTDVTKAVAEATETLERQAGGGRGQNRRGADHQRSRG